MAGAEEEKKNQAKVFLVFVVMSVISCVVRFHGKSWQYYDAVRALSRVMLAVLMAGGASMRLDKKKVDGMLAPIVPPPLPPLLCVYVSGIVEAICAVLLLVPSLNEKGVGGGLVVALLWAVFPANIYQAFSKKAQVATDQLEKGPLFVRIAIQFLFLGWAGWFAPSSWEGYV